MEEQLRKTKERGNLSFSKDDELGINDSANDTQASSSKMEQSSLLNNSALLCETIKALERGKQAEKELYVANQFLQDQAHFKNNKQGKIQFENQLIK